MSLRSVHGLIWSYFTTTFKLISHVTIAMRDVVTKYICQSFCVSNSGRTNTCKWYCGQAHDTAATFYRFDRIERCEAEKISTVQIATWLGVWEAGGCLLSPGSTALNIWTCMHSIEFMYPIIHSVNLLSINWHGYGFGFSLTRIELQHTRKRQKKRSIWIHSFGSALTLTG